MIWAPKKGNVIALIDKELKNFLASKGANIYDKYSTLAWDNRLHALSKKPED